jgi:hypothetical protein
MKVASHPSGPTFLSPFALALAILFTVVLLVGVRPLALAIVNVVV